MGDTVPTRRLPLGRLAAAAFVVAVVGLARWDVAPPPEARSTPLSVGPAARSVPPEAPPAAAMPPPAATAAPRVTRRIETQARHAVDRYLDDTGLADSVDETERAALVTALGQVRGSSRWSQHHAHPRPAAETRRREALLEADRVFRETLGIGVGEFIAALSPPGTTIEDLGAARQ